jgi:hypothetical protein
MDTENKKEDMGYEKDTFSSFVGDLGIDKNILDSLKPMIPMFLAQIPVFFTQFIKGVPKFVEEEKKIQEMKQNSIKEKGGLLIQNIYSVRALLLTLTGFSLTVVAAVLSFLTSRNNFFDHINLLYIGLMFLGLNIIGSISYLLYIHTIENNKLYNHYNFDMKLTNELRDLLARTYVDSTKTFDNYFLEKKVLLESRQEEEYEIMGKNKTTKKDWYPHILSGFFLTGLIFIVISFFLVLN